jgi:hypothetical protein
MPREPAAPSSPVGRSARRSAADLIIWLERIQQRGSGRRSSRPRCCARDGAGGTGTASAGARSAAALPHARSRWRAYPVCVCLSARAMTKTRFPPSRLGEALRALDQPAGMSGGSGFAIESASWNDRRKVEQIGRWFHRVSACGGVRPRTPASPRCVALDPMFAGSRLPGAVRVRPSNLVGLDCSGKWNESLASDRRQKPILSAVIAPDARKSFVEIVFCRNAQRAVSD